MKFFKLSIIAIIAFFAFGSANAQINVRIGPRHRRPHRVVVVHRPVYRHHRHYRHH